MNTAIRYSVPIVIDEKNVHKINSYPQDICYHDIINYPRSSVKGQHTCVMCGKMDSKDCVIPSQNKDVCKMCDSLVWFSQSINLMFKFCKGCKNFVSMFEFCDKPKASKCGKCRNRCRSSYSARRSSSSSAVSSDASENSNSLSQSASGSPRGVSSLAHDSADRHMQFSLERRSTPPTVFDTHSSSLSSYNSHQYTLDGPAAYNYERDRDISAHFSPAMYGIASPFATNSVEKENRQNASIGSLGKRGLGIRPRIGGVLGDRHVNVDGSKTPKVGEKIPTKHSTGSRIPRIPNSFPNIVTTVGRSNEGPASTPAGSKGELDELLLLSTALRKSPLTFISGMPSPDNGFGSGDFSPAHHQRMYLDQRIGSIETPHLPATPLANPAAPTPGTARSWDSQEGGAWYHDVLVAMSQDNSVKKEEPLVREVRNRDEEADNSVAKRIRYGDAASPSPEVAKKEEGNPPYTPVVVIDNSVSAVRGSFSCPERIAEKVDHINIDNSQSASKVSEMKEEQGLAKWQWDPKANPLMHLAMMLSKNEANEDEIFRDLSSDSDSADDSSDFGSVRIFRDNSSSPTEELPVMRQ